MWLLINKYALSFVGLFIALTLMVATSLLRADPGKYLEANTVYCFSKQNLVSYIKFAQARDMQGLNLMVETGECDFTPDGKNVSVPSFRSEKINSTLVVRFPFNGKTVWTFKTLLKSFTAE